MVYRSLDSLLTFFHNETCAKGKGFYNKLIQHDFVGATYLLMDVLPIISKLCLVFQKKDLDVSMVEVHVDHCFAELQKLKQGKLGRSTYLDKLKSDITKDSQGKTMFKGNQPLILMYPTLILMYQATCSQSWISQGQNGTTVELNS